MPYRKLTGQAFDSGLDDGAGGAPLQQGNAATGAGGGTSVFGGGSTVADFPDFEEIVGHSPSTDVSASTNGSAATENGSTTASTTTQIVTASGSGLVFNNTFGSGATQAFINDVDAAENYLQSLFGNVCTVNCNFNVAQLNPNFSGENSFDPITVSYSQFVNALTQHASTPEAQAAAAALASLPDPSSGAPWKIPVGEAQILGLASPDGVTDDSIVLNSDYWTASALANDPSDAEAVIEHELSEGIMGRIGSLGIADPGYWAPMDLFRFTASGQRDFTGGKDGQLTYFSVNGANINTGLQYHNSVNSRGQFDGEDLADWDQVGADANATDPFGPGGPGVGDPGTLSATDIQIMEALGWAPPHQTPTVTGQNFIVAANQSVAISNYFNVANPSGDSITQYAFEDLGGGNGHFTVNGTTEPDNQVVTVATGNLSTVQYVGGSSAASDNLLVGIFDATTGNYDWSPSFTASTAVTIQTDGSTTLAQAGNNYFLFKSGTLTGPELQYNGSPVTVSEFDGWVPIGAVQMAGGGYDVAWELPGGNQYTVWSTDSSGNKTGNVVGVVAGNTYALEAIEPLFNQDLNGDGKIGPVTTPIQTDGSTTLSEGFNEYFVNGGSGLIPLQYNGSPVAVGEFGNWVPFGAVQTATGYDVAWELPGGNQYTVWSTDSSGNKTGNPVGVVAGNDSSLESIEPTFDQDLNGDGTIGVLIQKDGSTTLSQGENGYYISSGGGLITLQYNGSPVTVGEFGSWLPFGAVQTATGYDVAWELPGADQYTVWTTDSSGNKTGNVVGVVAGNAYALEAIEPVFNQDLNGDKTIGLVTTPIRTDGATTLSQVANEYFVNSGSGPDALQYNGSPVTVGEFGIWVPFSAVQTATGYDVAWELPGADQYTVWTTDSSGNKTGNVVGSASGPEAAGNSVALEAIEPVFNQDLNGDGVIGIYAAPGTTLQISQALSGATGAATIGSGATLDLLSADSASVTFQASTGILELADPAAFSGTIFGFTGTTLSDSDQIDLQDIKFSSVHDSFSGGILSIGDGSGDSASLDFNGTYTPSSFQLASDSSGGTIVYDPPPSSQTESSLSGTSDSTFGEVSQTGSAATDPNPVSSPLSGAGEIAQTASSDDFTSVVPPLDGFLQPTVAGSEASSTWAGLGNADPVYTGAGQGQGPFGAMGASSDLVPPMSGFFSTPAPMVEFSPTPVEAAGETPIFGANPLQHTA